MDTAERDILQSDQSREDKLTSLRQLYDQNLKLALEGIRPGDARTVRDFCAPACSEPRRAPKLPLGIFKGEKISVELSEEGLPPNDTYGGPCILKTVYLAPDESGKNELHRGEGGLGGDWVMVESTEIQAQLPSRFYELGLLNFGPDDRRHFQDEHVAVVDPRDLAIWIISNPTPSFYETGDIVEIDKTPELGKDGPRSVAARINRVFGPGLLKLGEEEMVLVEVVEADLRRLRIELVEDEN